jgi:hypothetical protein
VIDRGWKSDSPNNEIRKCFLDVRNSSNKSRFKTWISWNDVKCVSLFHPSYLIKLMPYLCSQRTPNVQIKYFIFVWSVYRLFVVNRGWNRDSLQIMKFIYVCSTWGISELKTRLETLITLIVVSSVCLFNLLILQHLWITRSHKGHHMSKSSIYV